MIAEIKSIADMINEMKKLIEKYNELLWYRGHSVKTWELVPSVQRGNYKKEKIEQYLVNDFFMKSSISMKNRPDDYITGWMTLMQHYGLPTRLLDWSASPLVALFFATNDYKKYKDEDGCIWVLRPGKLNELEGFDSYIYPMDKQRVKDMLRPAFHALQVNEDVKDKIIACRPVEYDMRVYTQQSAFTIHNTSRKIEDINDQDILSQFIIPVDCKAKILMELKMLGITLSNIYPDNEHIAQELKEFYE